MSDNFYPFIDQLSQQFADIEENEPLPLYKEIAWDFKKEMPLVENNEFKIVEENEAICVWIWHSIKTYRYAFSIYSWDFGSEIDALLGQNYTPDLTKTEVTRYINEAILINPYILSVDKISVDFKDGSLEVYAKVTTIYSELEVSFIV